MIAQTDVTGVLAAVIPLAVAVLGGGFAMAWRLGRLEQRVNDVKDDVKEIKDDLHRTSR